MMGKQYNRMKQLAKQNILRAEKTEVLNNDLQQCEKKVDLIKDACQKTVKKMSLCFQGSGQDVEKRTRKLPHSVLGQSMQESSQALGENSVFGLTLGKSAEVWTNIGQELTSHEMGLESVVIQPFSQLLDNEIPSIMSLRRKLNKLTLDLDSSKGRFQATSNKVDKDHITKAEVIRDEMEQCQWKVDACKENLATEMMNLVAKDSMLARCLVDMVESQAQYHRSVLVRLEKLIPQLKADLTEATTQGVFGLPLEDHLRLQGREIASPLETCIFWIMELGLDEEGIFRIAGSSSKIKLIRAALDANVEVDVDFGMEHAVAGVLKQYLRELPEPLLTFALYPEFVQTLSIKGKDQQLQAYWTIVNKLPTVNYNNFRYLIKFLSRVDGRSEVNKMNSSNLSLVIGPNCLWSEDDGGMSVTSTGVSATIIESFIKYADWFFPEDINFTITKPKCNSFSEPNVDVDDTVPIPASTSSPSTTAADTQPGSPAVSVTSMHLSSSPFSPGQGSASPHMEGVLLTPPQNLLTDRLRSMSLPRKSKKAPAPAPPVPNLSPTSSPTSTLLRNMPAPSSSNLVVNGNNHAVSPEKAPPEKATLEKATLEKVTPEKATPEKATPNKAMAERATPEKATPEQSPPERPVKMDKPIRPDKPAVLERPVRPPVPVKKVTLGPDSRVPVSPPPAATVQADNVPPSPSLRHKSNSVLARPTASPPPPPKRSLDNENDENTQL